MTFHAGWRLGLFLLLLALLAALVVGLFLLFHFPPQRSHGVLQPLPLLGSAVAVVALALGATLLCLRFVERRPLATVGLPGGRLWYVGVLQGALLGAIVPLTVCGILRATGYAVVETAQLSAADLLRATLPMAASTLLLGFWEELAFRGYGLQLLSEIGGPWLGASLTGIGFGLAHSGNPGANLTGFVNLALNAVLLAWIVIRSGSLWLACGYHAGWNLMASNLLGMRDSGITAPGAFFSTTLSGPAWLSGGAFGFEASVLTGVAETLVLLAILSVASRLTPVAAAQPYFAGHPPRPSTAAAR